MNQFDRFIYNIDYIALSIGGGILLLMAIIKIFPYKGHKILEVAEGIVLIVGIIGFIYYLWLAIFK